MAEIEYKWGFPSNNVTRWIKNTGSFKLRKPRLNGSPFKMSGL